MMGWFKLLLAAWFFLEISGFIALNVYDIYKNKAQFTLVENVTNSFNERLKEIKGEKKSNPTIEFNNPIVGWWHPAGYKAGDITINEKGFYDNLNQDPRAVIFPEKPKEIYRIILMGGSSALGVPEGPKDTIAAKLEKTINFNLKDIPALKDYEFVQVLNFAQVSGISGNNLSRLTQYLIHTQPDALLMYTGFNDAIYSYFGLNLTPFLLSIVSNQKSFEIPDNSLMPFSSRALRELVNFAKSKSQTPSEPRKINLGVIPSKIEAQVAKSDQTVLFKNMKIFASIAKEYNFNFISILQPSRQLIGLKDNKINSSDINLKYVRKFFPKYISEWSQLQEGYINNKSISFIDATKIFESKTALDYFSDDGFHLTPNGNEIIAQLLFKELINVWGSN